MTYEDWQDQLERSGWWFGLAEQKQMLADWRTDRAEWRAALKEARQEIARLKEIAKPISPNEKAEQR
jgi:hypothetical protein